MSRQDRLFSSLCAAAQVDPDKAGPRSLVRMYQRTRDEIRQRIEQQAEKEYQQMLHVEQQLYGWDEPNELFLDPPGSPP